MKIRVALIFLFSLLVSSCANEPLKAPCNHYGTFCGAKTKINK